MKAYPVKFRLKISDNDNIIINVNSSIIKSCKSEKLLEAIFDKKNSHRRCILQIKLKTACTGGCIPFYGSA